jgi:hypothetical protein
MRMLLKIVSGLLLAAGSIQTVISFLMLFESTQERFQTEIFLGGGLGTIVFAGMLWVLVDIANAITVRPDQREIGLTDAQKALLHVGEARG